MVTVDLWSDAAISIAEESHIEPDTETEVMPFHDPPSNTTGRSRLSGDQWKLYWHTSRIRLASVVQSDICIGLHTGPSCSNCPILIPPKQQNPHVVIYFLKKIILFTKVTYKSATLEIYAKLLPNCAVEVQSSGLSMHIAVTGLTPFSLLANSSSFCAWKKLKLNALTDYGLFTENVWI